MAHEHQNGCAVITGKVNQNFSLENQMKANLGYLRGKPSYDPHLGFTSIYSSSESSDTLNESKEGKKFPVENGHHIKDFKKPNSNSNDGFGGYCSFQTDCLERPLSMLFEKYGYFLGQHPVPFVIFPVIMTALLALGILRLYVIKDIVYLFTPTNAPAIQEGNVLLQNFPNFTENGSYIPGRDFRWPGDAEIIIKINDGNVLTEEGLNAAIQIDDIITNQMEIEDGDMVYKYRDLCANFNGVCINNTIIDFFQRNPNYFESKHKLRFPNHYLSALQFLPLGHILGGVTTDTVNGTLFVKEAKAMRLTYYLVYESKVTQERARKWMAAFRNTLEEHTIDEISFYWRTEDSVEKELDTATVNIIPQFSITYIILIAFVILSAIMQDPVRSKPWLASLGVLNAGLAILSGLGICMAGGLAFTSGATAVVPFLVLGIGVDDMFVLLSAWRQTDVTEDVPTRMSKTMRKAAVSITITTLTDILAFGVGAFSVFRFIQNFCIYTVMAVLFAYLYSITFLSACMVLSGRLEEKWKVCFCITKRPKDLPNDVTDPECLKMDSKSEIYTDHLWMKFFSKVFGPFVANPFVKGFTCLLWLVYVALAIWGCCRTEQGLDLKHLVNDGSYMVDYYNALDAHFNDFGPFVMVMVTSPLDYSQKSNQAKIKALLTRFEDSKYFLNGQNISWLDAFLAHLNWTNEIPPQRESAFVESLIRFFNTTGMRYKLDVNISAGRILSSRFLVQCKSLGRNPSADYQVMSEARRLAADTTDLDISVYNFFFVYIDQYSQVIPSTITNIIIAFVFMLIVSLFLIPHPLIALWVAFSIISIEVGVIGFMTFWGVSLDAISMVILIVCIGFAVDFSAHIAYAYMSSQDQNKEKKVISCVTMMGFPILQGGVSTMLGVAILAFSKSYVFRTFFKTIFLVMTLGMWHALFVLPVAFTLLVPTANVKKQHTKYVKNADKE